MCDLMHFPKCAAYVCMVLIAVWYRSIILSIENVDFAVTYRFKGKAITALPRRSYKIKKKIDLYFLRLVGLLLRLCLK